MPLVKFTMTAAEDFEESLRTWIQFHGFSQIVADAGGRLLYMQMLELHSIISQRGPFYAIPREHLTLVVRLLDALADEFKERKQPWRTAQLREAANQARNHPPKEITLPVMAAMASRFAALVRQHYPTITIIDPETRKESNV